MEDYNYNHEYFINETIKLARENVKKGGRPFSCLIVKNNNIIEKSCNMVEETKDPTAHAEILAIRNCCIKLGTENLNDCYIYVLAHPCPMCLGSLYYCSPKKVIFITQRDDYSKYYKDDRKYFQIDNFYDEFNKKWDQRNLPMEYCPNQEGINVYKEWMKYNN